MYSSICFLIFEITTDAGQKIACERKSKNYEIK